MKLRKGILAVAGLIALSTMALAGGCSTTSSTGSATGGNVEMKNYSSSSGPGGDIFQQGTGTGGSFNRYSSAGQ